jgi:hypothetical protein
MNNDINLRTLVGTALIGATASIAAVELPDCKLEYGALLGSPLLERLRQSADAGTFLNVAGKLRNGENLTFAKDDPVMVADLKVTRTHTVLYPAADINLKSSWLLSYGFNFTAKSPLPVQGEVTLDDGRRFKLIQTKARQVLFIDEQDHFCNKALNAASPPAAWAAGTLSLEGDDVALDSRVVEEAGSEGSVRVICNGVGGGQMGFQEVWVNGATVVASFAHNFDQFAKTIKVGPFTFDIMEVSGGKVTLRYEIAERAPVNGAEARKWPMRTVRR